MSTKIFVNLPVKDLGRSIDFFTELGFSTDPQFSDENATCVIIGDDIYAMLLKESFFSSFTKKELVDATRGTEAILAVGVDRREEVDELVDKALAAGGQPSIGAIDEGFMYSRSFQDPDGHLWEAVWMDVTAAREQT
ncbi:VOC family protein [Allosalinactinospora lopnorensis]|uniref:VOC family protein n=1 Tax=Allosalinactinospora lopnorensis TaxID=1352348 RepID=UPI000623FE21|nr:VOC family protein [Allosalinactinospora lopnorensis]